MNWEKNIIDVRIGNTSEHVMFCLSKLIHTSTASNITCTAKRVEKTN